MRARSIVSVVQGDYPSIRDLGMELINVFVGHTQCG